MQNRWATMSLPTFKKGARDTKMLLSLTCVVRAMCTVRFQHPLGSPVGNQDSSQHRVSGVGTLRTELL